MRWERKPDLGFIKRNWDKRGLMECQKLLSREAREEVGIKGRWGAWRTAVLLSGCVVCGVQKRNFAQMCSFSLLFFSIFLRCSGQARLRVLFYFFFFFPPHLLETGILHCVCWFLSRRATVFVLLIIIFVATGNRKGMQTVHWRKVN